MRVGKDIDYDVPPRTLARILKRCTVDPETGCWLWPGATDQRGYAQARIGKHARRLSRVMRHVFRHDLNGANTVNHIDKCRNPLCINPDHVPPLGLAPNIADGNHARRTKRLAKMLSVITGRLSEYVAMDDRRDPRAMELIAESRRYIKRLPKALRPKRKRVTV